MHAIARHPLCSTAIAVEALWRKMHVGVLAVEHWIGILEDPTPNQKLMRWPTKYNPAHEMEHGTLQCRVGGHSLHGALVVCREPVTRMQRRLAAG
jgi:hypothetical protein